ncbi:hypothetical protein [Accumulibacter sp.]|nr:hypothetical protein [Accumulibacter sp.]
MLRGFLACKDDDELGAGTIYIGLQRVGDCFTGLHFVPEAGSG